MAAGALRLHVCAAQLLCLEMPACVENRCALDAYNLASARSLLRQRDQAILRKVFQSLG